jgi:23S rRNA pseudouridine955/2504/2580 synthase
MKEFTISHSEEGQRLDKYLNKVLPIAPMSFHYKMLRKKNITLNGKKADGKEKIQAGDVVRFFLSDETFDKFASNNKQNNSHFAGKSTSYMSNHKTPILDFSKSGLKILYEDTDILVFDKPAGMLSQKSKPEDISVNDYLLAYLDSFQRDSTFVPSVCNRLDRNTSGIILCGKSLIGSQELGRMLKERSLAKYYRCIVIGRLNAAELTGYLRKDEKTNKIIFSENYFKGSDRIETAWKPIRVINVFGTPCTELEVHLITGKTHQIRGHLSGIGHPILGDYKYGQRSINEVCKKNYGFSSQLLHAYKVVFPSKLTKLPDLAGLTLTAPLPGIFSRIGEKAY